MFTGLPIYLLLLTSHQLIKLSTGQALNIFDPNYECSPEGAEVQRANVYFRCRNRRLTAAGCLGLDNIRVPINQTYKAFGSYDMLCKSVSTYWAQLVPLTCWMHNRQYRPGETFIDGHFWYTCVKSNDDIKTVISGCVGEKGEKVLPGGIFKRNSFVFTCARLADNSFNVEPTACLHKGKQFMVGQDVYDTHFIYRCVRENNVILLRQAGCMYQGRRISIGEKYQRNTYAFQCEKDGNIMRHKIVGCVGPDNTTYSVGKKWTMGTAPFRYVVRCTQQPGGSLMHEFVQCAYDHSEGRAVLKPGCMRRVGSWLVLCQVTDFNSMAYKLYSIAEPLVEQKAAAAGFKLC